jgi:hypothetical protein
MTFKEKVDNYILQQKFSANNIDELIKKLGKYRVSKVNGVKDYAKLRQSEFVDETQSRLYQLGYIDGISKCIDVLMNFKFSIKTKNKLEDE